ncbi:hypothetical protein R75483_03891 [Paraburkholderia domus]|nr:hypothetical protein R75483_03891 [Paraburkholderia domus]
MPKRGFEFALTTPYDATLSRLAKVKTPLLLRSCERL